jgi:hypothetical protein
MRQNRRAPSSTWPSGQEFAKQIALEAEADRAEEERIKDLERQLAEARRAARRRHRETSKPVSFTMTDIVLETLRAEAKRRGLSRSATVSALIEEAHRGELDSL